MLSTPVDLDDYFERIGHIIRPRSKPFSSSIRCVLKQ
jgi:hypothetical protein